MEYIFRSWNEELKQFFYFENGIYLRCGIDRDEFNLSLFDWRNAEQGTGLKLRNGTEIFVGDNFFDETENSISTVVIKEHIFQWGLRELYQGMLSEVVDYYPIVDVYLNRIAKLGNIHQNKELLEIKK